MDKQALEKLSFEEALTQLEQTVSKLQQGQISLEESMTAFKEGVALSKYCADQLQEAEETMTKLIQEDGQKIDLASHKSEKSPATESDNQVDQEILPF